MMSCRKSKNSEKNKGVGSGGLGGVSSTAFFFKISQKTPFNYSALFGTSDLSVSFWENPGNHHFHGVQT